MLNDRIMELGGLVKNGEMTWQNVADMVNAEFGENLSRESVRSRFRQKENSRIRREYLGERDEDTSASRGGGMRMNNGGGNTFDRSKGDYTTEYSDGVIEAQRIVEYNREVFGDKRKMLEYLGYSPDEWEFVFVTTSVWQQHTKEQTTKELYAVKFKVRPLVKEVSLDHAMEAAKEVFKKGISPLKFKKQAKKVLNPDRLMEIPAIELHLGKYAEYSEVGEDYSTEIAKERFRHILEECVHIQEKEMCDTAIVMIGNDFFNSDTVGNTTTKGTQQFNDVRWKSLFIIGLELYKEFFITLRSKFNHIEVRLCQGNHDTMSSFYLYMVLSAYFAKDEIISFCENYREYQCYQFGDNAIFFGHGDGNTKRIIQSIPAEFYKEWGTSRFRELHLAHYHKEWTVDDTNGMIVRRLGSPTATDAWHYSERFIGATQKQQVFVWDAHTGLKGIEYITFNSNYKKELTN